MLSFASPFPNYPTFLSISRILSFPISTLSRVPAPSTQLHHFFLSSPPAFPTKMSFRKRNEPLTGTTGMGSARGPSLRAPAPRVPVQSRAPLQTAISPPVNRETTPEHNNLAGNPGVRPSTVTSQPTISTGCADLDRIMMHLGLPLGSSLLIEESGTTDFASVLLRNFAAQGIVHNRIDKGKLHCHVVVVGAPSSWAKDLPGEYKGSSKDQKKSRIAQDLSKVSVSNMAEKDLKIAWRYGVGSQTEKSQSSENSQNSVYEHYFTQFDITQRLNPGPSAQEITFVPVSPSFSQTIQHISRVLDAHPKLVVRIVLAGFLNPLLYMPQCASPTYVVPFVHCLRALLAKHPNLALVASLPLDLYPRESLLTHTLETLVDGVIHLQPFNPDMAALVERAYKNEPAKIQQGLVNIVKVPVFSERGMMMVRTGEYAFRNGRKKFEIEDWGIPVEESADPEPSTTKNIDF